MQKEHSKLSFETIRYLLKLSTFDRTLGNFVRLSKPCESWKRFAVNSFTTDTFNFLTFSSIFRAISTLFGSKHSKCSRNIDYAL